MDNDFPIAGGLTGQEKGAVDSVINLPDDDVPKGSGGKLVPSVASSTDKLEVNAEIEGTPGTLILGKDGLRISSSGRAVNVIDAYSEDYLVLTTRLNSAGDIESVIYRLGDSDTATVASVFGTQLIDPQEMLFEDFAIGNLISDFGLRPATTGDLRIEIFAGSLETGPVIFDKTVQIIGADIGSIKTVQFGNKLTVLIGDDILVKLSGVALFGGLQTIGQFAGQTVPFIESAFAILTPLPIATISDTSNIDDNFLRLNKAYTSTTAVNTGIAGNFQATSTVDTVVLGLFIPGDPGVSNPFITTVGSGTFSQNDIIQVSLSKLNNSFFEVEDHTGDTLTIKGVGTVPTVESFTEDDLIFTSNASATITKFEASVIRAGTNGNWEVGKGSVTPIIFNKIAIIAQSGITNGSVLFADSNGDINQDNSNLFWNDTANSLGVGTNVIDAAALLELSSTTKGFLLSRMTEIQRDAISSPPAGLILYDTDDDKLNLRTDTSWRGVITSPASSLLPGGIVFATDTHGIDDDPGELHWDNVAKKMGVGTGIPTKGKIHVKQALDDFDNGITTEGTGGGTGRFYHTAVNTVVIQKGSNTDQIELFDNNNIELHVTPGASVGGSPSGGLRITSPSTVVNSNAVITGHSSFNGNTQLWYLGSTSSSNNNISIINRQDADLGFATNDIERLNISRLGVFSTPGDMDLTTGTGGVFKFTEFAFRAGLDASNYLEIGHGGSNAFIDAVGTGGIDFRFEGATLATFTDFGHLHLMTNVDQKHTLKIITANNANDTGLAFENSGGAFTATIFRTDLTGNRADLIFAAGQNTNIDLLVNAIAIRGGAANEGDVEILQGFRVNSVIANVTDPLAAQDAATKNYVDTQIGSGDVVGPASAINDSIPVYDGTTGKLIKDKGAFTIDSGNTLILETTTNVVDQSLAYIDNAAATRTFLTLGNNKVIINNRASNGTIEIKANTVTAGAGGEISVALFEDDLSTFKTDITLTAYPNTRDDGTPTNILGTDINGNLISGKNEVIHVGGNFTDTTDQTITLVNTFQDITFNQNRLIDGMTHTVSSATFTIDANGVYLLEVAPQVGQGSGAATVEFQIIKNGTPLVDSGIQFTVGANSQTLPYLRWKERFVATDTFEIQWASDSANTLLDNITSLFGGANIPSIMLGVTQVGS